MSATDALNDKESEEVKWSDPLIGLQVAQFSSYLSELKIIKTSDTELVDISEYLCEWSRGLLNKTFGRTTQKELNQIFELFRNASEIIMNHASKINSNSNEYKTIEAYAEHIKQRTGSRSMC